MKARAWHPDGCRKFCLAGNAAGSLYEGDAGMEDERDKPETTSRRDFAKAVVTAAVAVPIAASLVGDSTAVGQSKTRAKRPAVTGATPTTIELGECPEQVVWNRGDHIPPMGIDGGGELRIESHNLFDTADTRSQRHARSRLRRRGGQGLSRGASADACRGHVSRVGRKHAGSYHDCEGSHVRRLAARSRTR